ncbi:hypothetical protein [Methylobacterium sp. P5_C11]
MPIDDTVQKILEAKSWAQRIAQLRLIPQHHGTGEHNAIYAAVARKLYMPHLSPDFAYIHDSEFYDPPHFFEAYDAADRLTDGFAKTTEKDLARAISECPRTLLVFRTLLGLTKDELAHASLIAAEAADSKPLSSSQIDKMERSDLEPRAKSARTRHQAEIVAKTIAMAMNRELFGDAPPGLRSKQQKPDTEDGWNTVRNFASNGVPLKVFLHQRHYGGAFRQVLDATSTLRGDLIEDSVQDLFTANRIPFIRTGSHNQAEIAARFEVRVTPAPDFVIFDQRDDSLKAMLECKGTNNGGTARDKALRFARLRAEAMRLNGVPLIGVLGGNRLGTHQ